MRNLFSKNTLAHSMDDIELLIESTLKACQDSSLSATKEILSLSLMEAGMLNYNEKESKK